jgi:hypothetical protein
MSKKHDKKVDRAFEVIDRLEKKEKKKAPAQKSSKQANSAECNGKRSGLQIRFALDALISDQDSRSSSEKNLHAGESNLLNFKITLPYIWKIPVIGKAALKIVKRIQTEEYPDSIRDILATLKKKKPL